MHRSSENVAAIATALAKAQTELSNPEKAMIGTVYNARSDSPQSFRYASLSSGLDIIRKALGSHQIAITQTTDIDRANGTVNLSNAQGLVSASTSSNPCVAPDAPDGQLPFVSANFSLVKVAMVKATFRGPSRRRDYVAATISRSEAIRQWVARVPRCTARRVGGIPQCRRLVIARNPY